MFGLSLSDNNAVEVAYDLERLAQDFNIRSLRAPLTAAIKEVVIPAFEDALDNGGHARRFAPLKQSTIDRKTIKGKPFPSKILYEDGFLRHTEPLLARWSFDTIRLSVGGSGTASAEYAPATEYAVHHIYGFHHYKGGFVQARDYTELTFGDLEKIDSIFESYVSGRVAAFSVGI